MGYSLNCTDCACMKCTTSTEDDSNICSSFRAYWSDIQAKKPLSCKCLENDGTNPLTALCSRFSDWKCLKCAKDNDSLSVCDSCKCFPVVKSEPFICPTYKMRVSANLRDMTRCPSCPDHVLCFTCVEDQFVNCCCHYVFFNRCGDPYFRYDDKEDICSFRESNFCSFMFRVLLNIPRLLCFGCVGLCENNVRCCYFTSINFASLLCCKCSDEEFCLSYTCLCFDCEKITKKEIGQTNEDLQSCKCGCCIYMKRKHYPFLDFDIDIQEPVDSVQTTSDESLVNTEPKASREAIYHDNSHRIISMFEIVNETQESFDESLDKTNLISKKPKGKNMQGRGSASKSAINAHHDKGRNVNSELDTSSESGHSYLDVKQIHALQKKLIYSDDEIDPEVKEIDGTDVVKRKQRNGHFDKSGGRKRQNISRSSGGGRKRQNISRSSMSREDSFETPKFHKTGILKSESTTLGDENCDTESEPFSIYSSSRENEHRTRKRAHFANEDAVLIKELFPVKDSEASLNGKLVSEISNEIYESNADVSCKRKRKVDDKKLRSRKKSTTSSSRGNDLGRSLSKSNSSIGTDLGRSLSKSNNSSRNDLGRSLRSYGNDLGMSLSKTNSSSENGLGRSLSKSNRSRGNNLGKSLGKSNSSSGNDLGRSLSKSNSSFGNDLGKSLSKSNSSIGSDLERSTCKSSRSGGNDLGKSLSKSNRLLHSEQNFSGSKTKRSSRKKTSSGKRRAIEIEELKKCDDVVIVDYDSSEEDFAVDKDFAVDEVSCKEDEMKIEDIEDLSE